MAGLFNARGSPNINGRISEGVLDDLPEEISELQETPAATNLLKIKEGNERDPLNKTLTQSFHHAVAQLIFTGIRCRKDAHTAI